MSDIAAFDQNVIPNVQGIFDGGFFAEIDGATIPRRCFHFYSGRKFVHDGTYMQQFSATVRAGALAGGVFRSFATTIPINSSVEYQGKLYMGGFSTGSVVNWDGGLIATEATIGTAPLIMAVFQETLLAFGTHTCKKRNLDGSWSSVSMPGGITEFHPRCAIQYLNKLYVGGFDNATTVPGKILSFDGTTLTDARTVSGQADATDVGCTDFALLNGKLYYAHNAVDLGYALIGQFDGTTWTDALKDIQSQVGTDCTIGALAEFRGALLCGLGSYGTAGGRLYKSPMGAPDGTYTLLSQTFTGLYDLAVA